ncbi:unnamed protein product [Bursaphelenchus okinawaensis]|uniref:Uncharacterized protein n=1 Tax=Bursaphelenchus okinawaensis TaxID=465554 RepID=A0A811KH42_9BILA|nr:unnamed protein product [Bursaphelenchus okinawaensis]CAG9103023.1 unnamed protein product [Bursaphelenchus okinawaensis]
MPWFIFLYILLFECVKAWRVEINFDCHGYFAKNEIIELFSYVRKNRKNVEEKIMKSTKLTGPEGQYSVDIEGDIPKILVFKIYHYCPPSKPASSQYKEEDDQCRVQKTIIRTKNAELISDLKGKAFVNIWDLSSTEEECPEVVFEEDTTTVAITTSEELTTFLTTDMETSTDSIETVSVEESTQGSITSPKNSDGDATKTISQSDDTFTRTTNEKESKTPQTTSSATSKKPPKTASTTKSTTTSSTSTSTAISKRTSITTTTTISTTEEYIEDPDRWDTATEVYVEIDVGQYDAFLGGIFKFNPNIMLIVVFLVINIRR